MYLLAFIIMPINHDLKSSDSMCMCEHFFERHEFHRGDITRGANPPPPHLSAEYHTTCELQHITELHVFFLSLICPPPISRNKMRMTQRIEMFQCASANYALS